MTTKEKLEYIVKKGDCFGTDVIACDVEYCPIWKECDGIARGRIANDKLEEIKKLEYLEGLN